MQVTKLVPSRKSNSIIRSIQSSRPFLATQLVRHKPGSQETPLQRKWRRKWRRTERKKQKGGIKVSQNARNGGKTFPMKEQIENLCNILEIK